MINNIKKIEEIKRLSIDEGRQYLLKITTKHKIRDLIKYWGISQHQWYKKIVPLYNMPLKNTGPKYTKKTNELKSDENIIITSKLKYINTANVDCKGDAIINILSAIIFSLELDKDYKFSLSIKELDFDFKIEMNGVVSGDKLQKKLCNLKLEKDINYNLNYTITR